MSSPPAGTRIALVDHPGSGAPVFARMQEIAAALERQVNEDYAAHVPTFGRICVVAVTAPLPSDWVVGAFKDADQPGALGYHDVTPDGQPLAKWFPILDAQDNAEPSTTISHELIEILGDALLCKAVQSPYDGNFWAYELCDAVEQDSYLIDNVPVSNFVTPQYFEPPQNLAGVKFDFMGLCTAPYEIRPGGYGQWNQGSGWNQVFHRDVKPRRYRTTAGRAVRRAKSARRA